MKTNVLLGLLLAIFLLNTLPTQSQTKPKKLPKTLLNSWWLEYHVFYDITTSGYDWDETISANIRIEKDKVIIEKGDVYWDSYWDNADRYTPTYEILENYQGDAYQYTETSEADSPENEFKIVGHLPESKTKGKLILQRNSGGSSNFYVLIYEQPTPNEAKFWLFYDFYNFPTAEFIAQNITTEGQKVRTFIAETQYNAYQNMPKMPALDETLYLQWWDGYLEILNQNANILAENNYSPKNIGIFKGNYQASKIRQEYYLKKGYNPYTSDEQLKEAIKKYGYNEQVRQKIRGVIDADAFAQTQQRLKDTWISDSYLATFGIMRQVYTISLKDEEIYINFKTETSEWERIIKDFYAEGTYYMDEQNNEFTITLPVHQIVPLTDEKEGLVVIGPIPDSLRGGEEGAYTAFGFKQISEQETYFNFSVGLFNTPEQAANGTLNSFAWEGNPVFVNKALYEQRQSLPNPPKMTLAETEALTNQINEKLFELGKNYEEQLFLSNELYFQHFLEQGYNPYAAMKEFWTVSQVSTLQNDLNYTIENRQYYANEVEYARTNGDEQYLKDMQNYLEEAEINEEKSRKKMEVFEAYRNNDSEKLKALKAEIPNYRRYDELFNKISELQYFINDIDYLVNDMEYYRTVSDENLEYFDPAYYRGYASELKMKYESYATDRKKIEEELNEAEKNNTIAFPHYLRKKMAAIDEKYQNFGDPNEKFRLIEEAITEIEQRL